MVFIPVTMVNLFYVSFSGPIFFLSESVQLKTLAIHLSVALVTLGLYFTLIKLFPSASENILLLPLKKDSAKDLVVKNSKPQRQTS